VDIRCRMLDNRRNSFQVTDVNLQSQSDTMSVGRPWCFHISLAKMTATSAVVFSHRGIKCAILINRSMTTQSWSNPSDFGSSVTKSIVIDFHGA